MVMMVMVVVDVITCALNDAYQAEQIHMTNPPSANQHSQSHPRAYHQPELKMSLWNQTLKDK